MYRVGRTTSVYIKNSCRYLMANAPDITIKSNVRVCDGQLIRFSHFSQETQCAMTCAVYLPPYTGSNDMIPALMYLSGLTCTDENVCQKGGAFRALAENRIAFICPDTSPRNLSIPGEDESWDFGTGAGFYLVYIFYSILLLSQVIYRTQRQVPGLPTIACIRMSPKSSPMSSAPTSPRLT